MNEIATKANEMEETEHLQNKLYISETHSKELRMRIRRYVEQLPPMELKPGMEDEWKRILQMNNEDEYSKAAAETIELWARVLQPLVPAGGDRKAQAFNAICMVDEYGLTGFQVQWMEAVLRKVWVHGDLFFSTEEKE